MEEMTKKGNGKIEDISRNVWSTTKKIKKIKRSSEIFRK